MLKNELRNKLIFDRLIGMMLVGDLRKKNTYAAITNQFVNEFKK